MANPIKATTHPRSSPETEPLNKPWNPATTQTRRDQETAQTRSIIIYAILAIAVLLGGYYLYATESPSTAVTSAVTKTDMTPTPNAVAGSTTIVPTAPPAATPPAAGNAPAPATTTTP